MDEKTHLTEEHRMKISIATKGRIPSFGHLGIKHSEETKRKISEKKKGNTCALGHRLSEESLKKLSDSLKGKVSWMKGKRHTEESILKMKASHKGQVSPNKGKPLSLETRQKISQTLMGNIPWNKGKEVPSLKGRVFSEETRIKISNALKGKPSKIIGRHHTEEARRKMREALKGKLGMPLEKHPNWQGGKSFEPYCIKFNNEFKERVRAFFGYSCLICGHVWQKGEKKLSVHHVNFRKDSCCNNDVLPLFVPLCSDGCHQKTNYNRNFWEDWFTEIINEFYNGKCYFTKKEWQDRQSL